MKLLVDPGFTSLYQVVKFHVSPGRIATGGAVGREFIFTTIEKLPVGPEFCT